MKRTQILAALLGLGVGLASAANAAVSVNLTSDATGYAQGATITLTTFVTANGGETDFGVIGNINFQDSLVNSNVGANSQVNLGTVGDALPGWVQVRAGDSLSGWLDEDVVRDFTYGVDASRP